MEEIEYTKVLPLLCLTNQVSIVTANLGRTLSSVCWSSRPSLEAYLLNQQWQAQIRQAIYYLQLCWNVGFLKSLFWTNRSQANTNKKEDLSKVFSQKCLINWPRSPQTKDAVLGSAAHLLCDFGPVADPLWVLGGWARGCPQSLPAQTICDLLHMYCPEGI